MKTDHLKLSEKYLLFELGTEEFGIEVNLVHEVLEYKKVFAVPNAPGYILGVINFRGSIIPLIDLADKLKLIPNPEKDKVIIVLEPESQTESILLGILVDKVTDVLEISLQNIRSTPDTGFGFNPKYLEGMVSLLDEADKSILLLNPAFLTEKDEIVNK